MAKTNSGKNGRNGRITKPQRTLCINYLDCLTAYEFSGGVRCKATNAGSIPRPAVVGRSMSKRPLRRGQNDLALPLRDGGLDAAVRIERRVGRAPAELGGA